MAAFSRVPGKGDSLLETESNQYPGPNTGLTALAFVLMLVNS